MHIVQLPDEFNMDIQQKMEAVSAIMVCPYCKTKLLNFSQNKLVKCGDLMLPFKEIRKELGFF